MRCDDCNIETGMGGNHSTDADCMKALQTELDLHRVFISKVVGTISDARLRDEAEQLLLRGSEE